MTLFDLVANKQYQNKHVLTKLIEHYTTVPYKEIILHYEDVISMEIVTKIDSDYRKYEKDKMPLEYIVWHVDFLGKSFAIDHRAMIPRPETEYMIEAVVEWIKNQTAANKNEYMDVLDLGCGCGVLGLSVGLHTGKMYIQSIQSRDISPEAVELTKQNIETYRKVLDEIQLGTCVSNGLSELSKKEALLERRQRNKLTIVCNYPYIPDDTFDQNADECARTWEPRSAFVGGKDGLDLYRILFGEIVKYNLTHSVLYLEMMTRQMEILEKEYAKDRNLEVVKTFHFNIIIVKAVRR
jgi:release factor glutamine methyltransferase